MSFHCVANFWKNELHHQLEILVSSLFESISNSLLHSGNIKKLKMCWNFAKINAKSLILLCLWLIMLYFICIKNYCEILHHEINNTREYIGYILMNSSYSSFEKIILAFNNASLVFFFDKYWKPFYSCTSTSWKKWFCTLCCVHDALMVFRIRQGKFSK